MDAKTAGRLSRELEAIDQEHGRRTPRTNPLEPVACEGCGRPTTQPRRGLCAACYHRERRGSPAVAGACCAACGTRDVRLLRAFRRGDRDVPLCWNCGHLARHARPVPETVEDLAQLVMRPGDRRRRGDRRGPRDRRGSVGDRRLSREGEGDRREGEERRVS